MRTRENTNIEYFSRPTAIFISIAIFFIFAKAFGQEALTRQVCFKDFCIDAEIADSQDKRLKGLMFRKDLARDQAMLFVFEEERQPKFWMKNVEFNLDIIWIGQDKRIADIKTNVPPCRDECQSIISNAKARYVLEARAGFVKFNQVKIGDRVSF